MTCIAWLPWPPLWRRKPPRPTSVPQIASVYLNRLREEHGPRGRPHGGLCRDAWGNYRGAIYQSDLQSELALQHLQVGGTATGPHRQSRRGILKAAMQPAATPFLFFVAVGDGSGRHRFSTNFEQHERNVIAYRSAVRAADATASADCAGALAEELEPPANPRGCVLPWRLALIARHRSRRRRNASGAIGNAPPLSCARVSRGAHACHLCCRLAALALDARALRAAGSAHACLILAADRGPPCGPRPSVALARAATAVERDRRMRRGRTAPGRHLSIRRAPDRVACGRYHLTCPRAPGTWCSAPTRSTNSHRPSALRCWSQAWAADCERSAAGRAGNQGRLRQPPRGAHATARRRRYARRAVS